MGKVIRNVAGHKEIEKSVAVVVSKGRPGRPAAKRDSGSRGNVGERAVMVIAVQSVSSGHIRDVEIRPAIVVEISNGHSNTPSIVRDPRLSGDVGKRAVVIVTKQRGMGNLPFAIHGVIRHAVHEVDIHPAIIVVFFKGETSPERIYDVLLLRTSGGIAPRRQARWPRNILKDHRSR